jgi:hypothetical protein
VSELVLSSSSADVYRRCSYRFYLEYVELVPQAQNVAAAIGLAFHAGAEDYYKLKLAGKSHAEIMLDDWPAIAEAYLVVAAFELAAVAEPKEDVQRARLTGLRTLEVYLDDVAPPIMPLYVEEALRVDVNDIPYSIHPDLIDTELNVRDHKVKRSKPRNPESYAFQQNGYAIGVRVLTGSKERDVILDIMIRLLRDRPYHFPIRNGGPISDYAANLFAVQLEDVANGIAKDRYLPEGLENGACVYCPVKAHCQPYQEEQARARQDTDDD